MPFDPKALEVLVLKYSSLTQVLIGFGFQAIKGVQALIKAFHPELSVADQDKILQGVKANAQVREALARMDAGGTAPTV